MWLVYTPSIPHNEGIAALKQKLEEHPSTKIPTNELVKLALNLFWKIIYLNLMTKLSNRFLELQLGLSSLLHTPVSIWINQRLIFLRPNISNHLFGCAILTIYFLYGRIEKQNLKSLWRNWTNFYLTLSYEIMIWNHGF